MPKATPKAASKTFKFATLKKEAEAKAAGREPRKTPPPFVMDDIDPPIVITAPDTVERQLLIAELIGPHGEFHSSATLPLLRALCGPAFPRVWALIKDDTEPDLTIGLVQAIFEHFREALPDTEANEQPGGSGASSN